jgi:DNA-binding transcriptional regulator YiaG
MTSAELRAILDQLHITQGAAARLLGHHRRSMEHWTRGDRQIPSAMAIVLRLLAAGRITADDIEWARGGGTDAP